VIIFRYLGRQVFQVMAAVTVILLVVAMITRFLQYLGDAVAGEISSDILLLLMAYRLPEFLLVILPFALFLGILLAYGRMYADNEMTVLRACGFSQKRLVGATLTASLLLALLAGVLSLAVAPWGLRNTEQLMDSQDELTELDLIVAGQFQEFAGGLRTTYAESIANGGAGRQLNNTFVAMRTVGSGNADREEGEEGETGEEREEREKGRDGDSVRIIVSDTARPVIDEVSGRRFMLLENGYVYDGVPGQGDYAVTRFEQQSVLMPETGRIESVVREKAMPTRELLGASDPEQQAELQWRLSGILIIPILALIAVPLSKVDPRQGRFSKLVPAALLYAVYYVGLQLAMGMVESGTLPAIIGLWWVHAAFLAYGCYLLRGERAS